ncbi:MAG: hypothetical protein Q9227_008961 [Pyrenula ochraceoflavens]
MARHHLRYGIALPLISLLLVHQIAAGGQNFPVPFNTVKSYGFDGPWQAITLGVGGWDPLDPDNANNSFPYADPSKQSQIDMYPGGSFSSIVITQEACSSFSKFGECGTGGTWEPPENDDIAFAPTNDSPDTGIYEDLTIYRNALTNQKTTVFNCSISTVQSGNITNPDGSSRGVELGNFALGAEQQTQVFSLSDDGSVPPIEAWTFSGRLFNQSQIPSYSYAMHIGSVPYNYPGSLVFGGYDKGRMLGQATSFDGSVVLTDISIGVETGSSPFQFSSKDQLLITNTSQPGSINVNPDPLSPYMYLPKQTCDALAQTLPVTFDQKSKYYLWNTNDPNFKKVVSSPAWLGFTFPPAPGQTDEVLIKVPFGLLNLTLSPPIVSNPVQYFPCMPVTPTSGTYTLGRAFLQSAFLGRNWNRKTTWLAQAPGPGVAMQGMGVQYTDIENDDTEVTGFTGNDLFKQSWSNHWTPIKSTTANDNSTSSSDGSSGLSTGAKAGIGIGAAAGAIIVLLGAALLYRRQRQTRRDSPGSRSLFSNSQRQSEVGTLPSYKSEHKDAWQHGHQSYMEPPLPQAPAEADSRPRHAPLYEPDSIPKQYPVYEMPSESRR